MSDKMKMVVAPSTHVHGADGLFTARKIVRGQLVCPGSCVVGGWAEQVEEEPASASAREPSRYTIRLELRHMMWYSRTKTVRLEGNPHRDAWAVMNSSEGLEVVANVAAKFGDGSSSSSSSSSSSPS
jgi:hypothetical protein